MNGQHSRFSQSGVGFACAFSVREAELDQFSSIVYAGTVAANRCWRFGRKM